MDKNPEALSVAFRRTKAKKQKIAQLGITADMPESEVNALILNLAEAKAIEEMEPMEGFVKGQRWYVEDLIEFSKLNPKDQLEYEYSRAFADVATEQEMLAALETM